MCYNLNIRFSINENQKREKAKMKNEYNPPNNLLIGEMAIASAKTKVNGKNLVPKNHKVATAVVNMEPHWCQLFNLAEEIVTSDLKNGTALVLELLQYGKRLNQNYVCEVCEVSPDN